MQMVETKYDFTDEDEAIIEQYILSSFASKDGKASGIMTFSSKDAEKQRAKSKVYAIVQNEQKKKTKALYGDGSKPKTRDDFSSLEEYMAYTQAQHKTASKQISKKAKIFQK